MHRLYDIRSLGSLCRFGNGRHFDISPYLGYYEKKHLIVYSHVIFSFDLKSLQRVPFRKVNVPYFPTSDRMLAGLVQVLVYSMTVRQRANVMRRQQRINLATIEIHRWQHLKTVGKLSASVLSLYSVAGY